MRVVFLGSPRFAIPTLDALVNAHNVVGVVAQPDREKDRKGNVVFGAVKEYAIQKKLPLYQFESIKREGVSQLKKLNPDVLVTCAYGQILSKEIIDIAPLGVINVHGSLLPKYRGSAPIQRALMDGEKITGITIMKTDEGMDSGEILRAKSIQIEDNDYVDNLFDKLSILGAELLITTLSDYASGKIKPTAQNEKEVSYAPRLKKEEAYLDFCKDATVLRNVVRGMGYGVFLMDGQPVKVYNVNVIECNGDSGKILKSKNGELIIACGKNALSLTELQPQGKRRMNVRDFLNGYKINENTKVEMLEYK